MQRKSLKVTNTHAVPSVLIDVRIEKDPETNEEVFAAENGACKCYIPLLIVFTIYRLQIDRFKNSEILKLTVCNGYNLPFLIFTDYGVYNILLFN